TSVLPARHSVDIESGAGLQRLCHDLRQFVGAGLLLSRMPGDDDLSEEVRHRLDLIHQQFASIAELVAAETAERAAEPPKDWILDLVELVDECVRVVQLTHRVTVDVTAVPAAAAYGDPALLRRAVSNVLDNASRAAGHAGKVTVQVGTDDDETWLEVSDNGAGFGRIKRGTGHGLQVVNSAVRASRGRLEISSGPGPGTTVRLRLPSHGLSGHRR
ncbi:MAG TPA: HAMP domain-containing sensor histidine kinase, partial [Kribbellaceae bacterium]